MKRSGTGSGLVQILTKLEEKLINVGKDLSLVKDIEIPRTYELSKAQLKSMESNNKVVRGINEGSSTEENLPTHLPRNEHNHVANVAFFMPSYGENIP